MAKYAVIILVFLLGVSSLKAAVVVQEPFDSTVSSWSSFDLDSFGHSTTEGNPAGSLIGTINAPNTFVPTLGAFFANTSASSGAFTGDYTDENRNPDPGIGAPKSFHFDFMAANVIPGSLALVLEGPGGVYFSFAFNLSGMLVDEWSTFRAPLEYHASLWAGGNESQFNTMLASVQSVEIQFNTAGSLTQTYYLDNVLLSDEVLNLVVIPEPITGHLLFLALVGLYFFRYAAYKRKEGA